MPIGECVSIGEETCTSATLFTVNPMWTRLLFTPLSSTFSFLSSKKKNNNIKNKTNNFAQSPISFYTKHNEIISHDILGSHIMTDDSCLIGCEVRRPVYTFGRF